LILKLFRGSFCAHDVGSEIDNIFPALPTIFLKAAKSNSKGQMHVITSGAQITRLSPVNQLRFIAATEDVSPVPMPTIKSLRGMADRVSHQILTDWRNSFKAAATVQRVVATFIDDSSAMFLA
jgi:hypothetical protein